MPVNMGIVDAVTEEDERRKASERRFSEDVLRGMEGWGEGVGALGGLPFRIASNVTRAGAEMVPEGAPLNVALGAGADALSGIDAGARAAGRLSVAPVRAARDIADWSVTAPVPKPPSPAPSAPQPGIAEDLAKAGAPAAPAPGGIADDATMSKWRGLDAARKRAAIGQASEQDEGILEAAEEEDRAERRDLPRFNEGKLRIRRTGGAYNPIGETGWSQHAGSMRGDRDRAVRESLQAEDRYPEILRDSLAVMKADKKMDEMAAEGATGLQGFEKDARGVLHNAIQPSQKMVQAARAGRNYREAEKLRAAMTRIGEELNKRHTPEEIEGLLRHQDALRNTLAALVAPKEFAAGVGRQKLDLDTLAR